MLATARFKVLATGSLICGQPAMEADGERPVGFGRPARALTHKKTVSPPLVARGTDPAWSQVVTPHGARTRRSGTRSITIRRLSIWLIVLGLIAVTPAAKAATDHEIVQQCLSSAASRHQLPIELLVLLYLNEGGSLGAVSHNTNGTVDIGPFQINEIWLPALANHWGVTQALTYDLLLRQLCANADAAAWILRINLNASGGDVWEALGRYHSNSPAPKLAYLRRIFGHVRALRQAAPPHG